MQITKKADNHTVFSIAAVTVHQVGMLYSSHSDENGTGWAQFTIWCHTWLCHFCTQGKHS